MICTKNLIGSYEEVPKEWIWMYYCNLWDCDFSGHTYKIHSVFREEHNPSMVVYFRGKYRFKDFGNGWSGDEVDLVKYLSLVKDNEQINYFQVKLRVVEAYNQWALTSNTCELNISDFKMEKSYRVEAVTRKWNELDKKYWTDYSISSKVLGQFNVCPLESFTMKEEGNEFTIQGEYIYGYYDYRARLCKIYQPKVLKRKFIFVRNYLQGEDQLKNHDYLIIQAGLKDIMAFTTMGLKTDSIAPHSENTMIHHTHIKRWVESYKQVLIMMDNDEPGHKSMEKYLKYGIKPVYHCIEGCKDVADIVRKLGTVRARQYFVPLVERILNGQVVVRLPQPMLFAA